jgi:hypothetical protein
VGRTTLSRPGATRFRRSWKGWPRGFRNDDFAAPEQTSIERECSWAKQSDPERQHDQIEGSDCFVMRAVAECLQR